MAKGIPGRSVEAFSTTSDISAPERDKSQAPVSGKSQESGKLRKLKRENQRLKKELNLVKIP
tara:strand:+ start:362 stop:547 length:186 start_codon:yes stop_codon:yes gene_type:complete